MTTSLDRPTPADPVRRIMVRDPAGVHPEDNRLAVLLPADDPALR